ncbi:MAG: TIGR03960 family B12-binding radical SAM protein [Clostridia bacterium]|nr:TIGR03960 family B12-binding radical SAM protein [Clostridia bacterium]
MNEKLRHILRYVEKPGRYVGGELNEIRKDRDSVFCRVAFCFPDTYEIGMSNLGVRILYGVLNNEEEVLCERAYAPWTDMEEQMRLSSIPLFTHESGEPVSGFDIVAFTLQYELSYSNVLNMLELSGIPLLASERSEDMPVILGGGPCTYNPEPVADFFDIFSIGEGEESLPELARLFVRMKKDGTYSKSAFLREASHLEGFYVPSLYDVSYNPDGTVCSIVPRYPDVPAKVRKRIVKDMDAAFYPDKPLVPYLETVHDRIVLEVFRGCIRGCRFCQAGMVYRPVRERSPEVLCRMAKCAFETSGYDEISLSSLSISDYTGLSELTDRLLEWTEPKKVSLSLPSMRVDSFSSDLMNRVASIKTGGLTFAPEAGTQRLRNVINKNVTEEDLLHAVRLAFSSGKTQLKLYFMNGLPTETDEDIEGIAGLAKTVLSEYYRTEKRNRAQAPQVTISVSCFIPKPFTPFQWEAQTSLEELERRQILLRDCITDRKIKYNWHDADVSRLEAVFARGNRKLSSVLLEARKLGVHFDAWDECFDYGVWMSAFDAAGIDPGFYANREMGENEFLPWDIIDCGVDKSFLLRERKNAYAGITTPSCREKCSGCGASRLGGKNSC